METEGSTMVYQNYILLHPEQLYILIVGAVGLVK